LHLIVGDMRVLVTGSSGFVGHTACMSLFQRGFDVIAFSRSTVVWPNGIFSFNAPELSEVKSYSKCLRSVDAILHLAGRAHILHEQLPDPLFHYRLSNVLQTLEFAKSAAAAGVRRFVFVSSVKVNGESTPPGIAFTETDTPKPCDPYGISKYEAESRLIKLGADTGMEIVIVRPTLIYGPGVKGNFRFMMNLLSRRLPLPFGAVRNNRRSLLGLDNFIDFLVLCLTHSNANGRTFLVSDGTDVSTAELLERLGAAMNVPVSLFPVPSWALKQVSRVSRNPFLYQRLCGSLVVDCSAAVRSLGWKPRLTFDEGLRRATLGFN
jgi:nucleoside-diphosphate-sugar epimerase